MDEVEPGWIRHFAQVLGVNRTSIYRKSTQRNARDEQDSQQLLAIHSSHPAYGYRRLRLVLGWSAGKTRRLMKVATVTPLGVRRKHSWKHTKAKWPVSTRMRTNLLKTATNPNGLVATYPHHVWAEDFTYLWFQNKWYYLATVIDLHSRQVVGWALGARHTTELIETALLDATVKHPAPAILHNDRGSEYCSWHYELLCSSLEIELSFSDKGSPWQNGFQESFYREFKVELQAKQLDRFNDLGELLEAVAQQLHYYNTSRIHTALQTNPAAYAARFEQKNLMLQHEHINRGTTGVRDRVLQEGGA